MSEKVYIFDTTLRDGEQSPGCSMNVEEKVRMAEQLARLGADLIECGFPIASEGDYEAVRAIAQRVEGPRLMGLSRAQFPDIDRAAEALRPSGRWGIHTFIATSDIHLQHKLKMSREQVLDDASRAVERARSHTEWVEFSAEDATRSDPDYLVEVFKRAVEAGAHVLNVPDTVGYTTPWEFGELIARVKDEVVGDKDVIISVHCHNDLGLGVANSLAAVRAGARQVECTVNGIGERAGNASMEEIVMSLATRAEYFGYHTDVKTDQIYPSSRLLSSITGINVQPNKAIVGANAFAHEAGIHQHGVLANKLTYEIMTPESVGIPTNQLVLGKHSGRHAFKDRLKELGFELSAEQTEEAFHKFKRLADLKKEVYDEDLERIVADELIQIESRYKLIHVNCSSGTDIRPSATVTLAIDGEEKTGSAFGDGPVDAALAAIKELTGFGGRVTSYVVKAISGGTDAQGDVTVGVEEDGRLVRGRGTHPDIMVASALSFLDAVNRMDYRRQVKIRAQGGI
ncbi:MAG: 2-isopropylmalate synthase [Chrysiogenetes bacterium]|nr:2-isopropylmalate synthase [Chrysiogenetes bacterium]